MSGSIITWLVAIAGGGMVFSDQIKALLAKWIGDRGSFGSDGGDGSQSCVCPEAAERAQALRNADDLIRHMVDRGDAAGERLARDAASQLFQTPAPNAEAGNGDQD